MVPLWGRSCAACRCLLIWFRMKCTENDHMSSYHRTNWLQAPHTDATYLVFVLMWFGRMEDSCKLTAKAKVSFPLTKTPSGLIWTVWYRVNRQVTTSSDFVLILRATAKYMFLSTLSKHGMMMITARMRPLLLHHSQSCHSRDNILVFLHNCLSHILSVSEQIAWNCIKSNRWLRQIVVVECNRRCDWLRRWDIAIWPQYDWVIAMNLSDT